MLARVFRKLGYYSEREASRRFRPEPAAFQFFSQYLGSEDVVVEAGAYRGHTTVGFLVHVARFVYAFEPNPDNFKHLKENSRGLEHRLRVLNLGLGDRDEVAEMRGTGSDSTFVYEDSEPTVARARVVPLDSLNLDPSPTVLVIDCEGMEVEAIRGAERTMEKVHSVLVEIHGDTEPKVREILSQAGFDDLQTRSSGWNEKGAYHDKWVLARRVGRL